MQARDGKIRVEFPTDALTEKTVIEVSDPSGDSVPAYSLLGKPFEIKAHKEKNGEDLKQFPKELSIFVSYEELDIPAEVEGSLYLYWFDENLGEWAALPTVVNKETKTLHALTDHFTVFDIGVNNWQSSRLPTVDSFQVSEFTGAGTYSYPINVPPGPGGFQPNLTLTYNSQVVDQATLNTPASWVGMGWSLDVGSIEIDLHGTPDWTYDDTYLLNLNGVSTRIVKDTNGVYHTTDENFLRIAFDGSKWTIWDKKGDVYYFDYGLSYPYQVGSGCPSTDTGVEWHVYRWPLTRVRNIFNQEIQYLYYQQTKSVKLQQYYTGLQTCKTIYNDAATATYLAAITYANGKYRIRFERGARNDYPAVWDTDGAFHAYEKYRLQNVYIEQDVDGNGAYETILRRYELAYKDNNASDIIFPGYTWTKGGKTNTLALIREYGINSVSALPPVTFTYGDNLHLTRVDNGYGGSVQFNYNLWYYPSHARKSHTVEQRFGRSGFPCKVDNSDPWHARSGEVSCGDGSGDPLHIWGSLGVARAFNFSNPNVLPQYGANSMRDLVRPGGVYKITANIGWTSAVTNVKVGINDGIRDHLQDVTTNGGLAAYYISLPSDASTVQAIVSETGGSGLGNIHPEYAAVSYYKIQLLPAVYRVSEKIISDGNGHEYKYSYSYSGAAVNDTITSPNGVCSYTVDPIYNSVVDNADCQEFFEKFSEFRGHAEVTVTAPDGTKTITRFHQDDTLKGRPKSVLTSDGKNTVQGTFYEYISTSLSIGRYAYCNVCFPYRGLGRTWTFTSAVENHIYNNNGAFYNASRTVYAYDPAYGNILTETEQSLVTDNWTTYRAKEYNYYPKDTVDRYLVSLPARIRTLDAGGGVLSSTLFVYDNLAGYNTQPINGVLTGVRTRMSVDGYQWSHVNYGYDAWGNRTSETTYSDYSAWNIAPANGARTTTTAYDTVFHVYPTSQTAPLGMTTKWEYDYDKNGTNDYIFGVPTKEIDPNNNATSAAYDAFGRMIALIRPGDDSALPTITIAYQDAFPFTTTIRQKIEGNQYYEVTRIYDGMGRQTRMISGGVISDTVYASAIETWQSMPYTGGETPAYTRTVVNPSTRTTTVIAPDGSQTVTQNNGLTTTVTDARGNSTVSIKDVWGRTVFVDAPENPDVAYEYDPMDRLIMVKRGSLLPPTDPSVNPGYTGLISWWSLDESGGVRNDSHGANHLADNNTVTAIAGRQSNAAKFTLANAEFLNIPDNPAVSMGSNALMTVCAWVKLDSANSTGVQNIVSKRGATNGTWEYFLRYDGRIDRFVFLVTSNGSSGTMAEARANSFGAPVLNTWYFVCGGYDGSSAWVSVNAGVRDTVPFSAGIFDGAADLRIGSGYNAEYLDGALDELILYKRALTQHEIAWLYNKGAGRSYADLASPPPPPPPSGNEIITTITYDHGGRKTALSDPDMGTWTYSYDALGNLTRQTDARGQRICLYYDSLNRLIGKHYRADDNCPANPTFDVTYSYDQGTYGKGHRTSMTDASGSTTWLYDARGRVTKETKVISGSSFVTEWTYNSADLPATMTYPGGEVVTTAYNSRMLPISVTGADNYVPSMTYDSASRPRTRALGSGLTQTYTYYPWNQQGGRLQTLATGSLQNLTYAYDANGNILSIADTVNNETQTFTTYDALDRLTSWTLNGSLQETYDYDPASGNLTSKGGVTLDYLDANHVHAVTNAGGNTYQYDANGNQITRTIGSDAFTLLYDAENRLVEVKKNGVTIAQFTYDGDGKRVKSVVDGETTLFVGSYYEQKGSQVTKYYFAGSTRIAMRKYTIPQSMSVEYFLGDHLGSTSITTDANGAKTSELRYKPWGEIRYAWTASLSTSPAYELTKYTYTGQYSHMDDPSTAGITEGFGLMFYNARWYDPSLGRFAQADTIVPVQSQGVQAWDRYAYANNNPIRNTDPTGHWIESVVDIAFIAYDIYDISQNGLNWENGLSLAADVAGLALPFVTGGGLLVRAATHADDVAKAINTADNIIDTANAIDNAIDAGNAADNLADGIKLANDVPCSFSAETDVATPDGAKDIAAIEIGDYVLAWNEADGTLGYYEVTAVMSHADEVLVELILDGEWIETTPEHPFYVKGKGWTPAEDLRMGDEIRQADGTTGRVWLTWTVYRTQAMYNLTVDTAHTFFVGEGQWLVHNACSSATLSNNLGGGIGDNLQAHHVIPCEYACHPFVERAKNSGWSMDEAYNGILLPDNIQLSKQLDLPVHNGPHPGYSGAVGNTLDQLERLAYRNNWSDNKAFQQLRNLADTLKTEIRNIGGGVWLR